MSKTIVQIDLSSASQDAVLDLAELCINNGLTMHRVTARPVEAAPVIAPLAKAKPAPPKRKAKQAKRAKVAAKKAPKVAAPKPKRAPSEKRDRAIAVQPEETAKVLGILREKDTGEGVMTEDVYTGLGGKTRHWQAVLSTLRAAGTIRDNGRVKRALRLFAPGVEHPTTGQTLTRKPRVRVRDAVTKAPKREYDFDAGAAAQGSAE